MNQTELRVFENLKDAVKDLAAPLKENNQSNQQRHREILAKLDVIVDQQKKSATALESIAKSLQDLVSVAKQLNN